MIEIDGSFGEGGGQILRTSCSLSAITGKPVHIYNIRAKRAKPGLRPQHTASVRAAAKVCGGELKGAKNYSQEITFIPGTVRPGQYTIEVGTAGSSLLIFQTIFPILSMADEKSVVTIHGGTHNPMAPSADFVAECFLPLAAHIGFQAECELIRHGFYPKGMGTVKTIIYPHDKNREKFDFTSQVDWDGPFVEVLLANLPQHVFEREKKTVAKGLGIDPAEVDLAALPGELGPGNALMVRYKSDDLTAMITSYGAPGKKAERVANEGARDAKNFVRSKTPITPWLSDQLLLLLALGPGGSYMTSLLTEHTRTNAHILKKFLDVSIDIQQQKPDRVLISVRSVY
jgi:RNA 3'-terminal phosphate cyclase (ATP)